MKNLILATILSIFCIQTADAQFFWGPQSSTVGEGLLNGASRIMYSRALNTHAYGNYIVNRERARSIYLDNLQKYNEMRSLLKKEADRLKEERLDSKSSLDRKADKLERRLDDAERLHALKQREQELIERGILKAQTNYFYYRGKRYENFGEFRYSPEYEDYLYHQKMVKVHRELETLKKEQKQLQMYQKLKMWREMSYFDRQRYSKMEKWEQERYKEEWLDPELKFKRLKEKEDRQFLHDRGLD